jgi:5'-nucleotidase
MIASSGAPGTRPLAACTRRVPLMKPSPRPNGPHTVTLRTRQERGTRRRGSTGRRDEADTVNALVPELREQGVEAIVVLVHEGGSPTALNINGCAGVTGPIVDVVNRLDPEVDLVVSGHTHQPYNCVFNGIPTTSAYSFGRLVTDIDMRVDRATKDVTRLTINNRVVTRDVPQNQHILDLIAGYEVVAAPIANRPIGRITAELLNTGQPDGEQVMGDVIADAQLGATDGPPPQGGAVVAFMNPGGVRGSLTFPTSAAGEGDGVVTFGEAFTVQPFGNILQTLSLTGAQIDLMLEQQFCGVNSPFAPTPGFFKVLLPSAGFAYTWDGAVANAPGNATCATDPALGAVNPASVTLNGVRLDLNATYRVTVNNFLADGGDGFFVLRDGTDRVGGLEDLQAFEAYLAAAEPTGISPPALGRITRVN